MSSSEGVDQMGIIVLKPVGGGKIDVFVDDKLVGSADMSLDGNYRGKIRLKKLM